MCRVHRTSENRHPTKLRRIDSDAIYWIVTYGPSTYSDAIGAILERLKSYRIVAILYFSRIDSGIRHA